MFKIILTENEYNYFEDCRNYIHELLARDNIDVEDLEFIEEIFSMLNSNLEF